MVCDVEFKQNIVHLGTHVRVLATHLNHRTAKFVWPQVLSEYFDREVARIFRFNCNLFVGDFNAAVTEVVPQLRSRGI